MKYKEFCRINKIDDVMYTVYVKHPNISIEFQHNDTKLNINIPISNTERGFSQLDEDNIQEAIERYVKEIKNGPVG